LDACGVRLPAHRSRARRLGLKAHRRVLGKFHEIGLATADIRASVEFYERLGLTQAQTGDTWSHPYGVVTDGRLYLGLHQRKTVSPIVTFVKPGIAQSVPELEARGISIAFQKTGEDVFNEIGFNDPAGQMITVLEARTYSPGPRQAQELSLLGYFVELSLPSTDFAAAQQFWEPLGFVATEESDEPYVHLPLTSDYLDVSFHRPRTLDRPALVFKDPDMRSRIAKLQDLGVKFSSELPRGLDPASNALLEAPEGTTLLLLNGEIS
jgi:catechol 2,3-dioxygenase-like lactoylglutathione lyase family enzyme